MSTDSGVDPDLSDAKINVTDDYHFFLVLSIVSLTLWLVVYIPTKNWLPKLSFGYNMGLAVLWWVQTDVGENAWPRGWYNNIIPLFFMGLFFFFILDHLWATIFLMFAALFINPLWEGVELQIEYTMSRIVQSQVDTSSHGAFYWYFVLLAGIGITISVVLELHVASFVVIQFTYSTAAMTAIKGFAYSQGTIICDLNSGSQMCPYWFNLSEWLLILGMAIVRGLLDYLLVTKKLQCCCSKEVHSSIFTELVGEGKQAKKTTVSSESSSTPLLGIATGSKET
jgi:hypothetical protein